MFQGRGEEGLNLLGFHGHRFVFWLASLNELTQLDGRIRSQNAVLNGRAQNNPERSNCEANRISSEAALTEAGDQVFDSVTANRGKLRLAKVGQHVPLLVIGVKIDRRRLASRQGVSLEPAFRIFGKRWDVPCAFERTKVTEGELGLDDASHRFGCFSRAHFLGFSLPEMINENVPSAFVTSNLNAHKLLLSSRLERYRPGR